MTRINERKVWSKNTGRNTALILAMSAVVLAFGLVTFGCSDAAEPDTVPKSIKITDIDNVADIKAGAAIVDTEMDGKMMKVEVLSSLSPETVVASGSGAFDNATDIVTVDLYPKDDVYGVKWTGNGKYFIRLSGDDGQSAKKEYKYLYAKGQPFATIVGLIKGTDPDASGVGILKGLPKLKIEEGQAETTVAFTEFGNQFDLIAALQ
ncbi:MAG: hypothetical protein Ta2A_13430 [Treponemataceae bacterium]|nr:MAG: hypothetical protein Ta2A_13430 [Treponemataceae bacterium]